MIVREQGWESDRLGVGGKVVRWWFFVRLSGEEARPQGPRLGVHDEGFTFARGGRASSGEEAQAAIHEAIREGMVEHGYWRGQPSHALGPGGELIPLGRPGLPA